MRKMILGAAAAAMLAGSSMAQAAAPIADVRAGSPSTQAENMHGGNGGVLWLAILAAALLAVLIFAINDNNNDTLPHSP